MKSFSTQIVWTLRDLKTIATVLLGCVFFSFAGPFGSFSALSILDRLLFWAPVFAVAFVITAVIHAFVVHILKIVDAFRTRLTTYLLFCAFFAPFLYSFLLSGPVRWGAADISFAVLSFWVLMTGGICTAIFMIQGSEPSIVQAEPKPQEPVVTLPRLFRRLDQGDAQMTVTRLTVNDHYVVVGLSDGSERRLLMRLSDAIAEMDDEAGFVTHRSHWVSQQHIQGVVYEGRREMLELNTGVRVPISRTYRPDLVTAGFVPAVKEVTDPPSGQKLDLPRTGT